MLIKRPAILMALILAAAAAPADTLGFFEQKFSAIHFEKNKWTRTVELPCRTYTASEIGATVDVLRYGTSNLVPFKATKSNLKVVICASTAAFDEGFEADLTAMNAGTSREAGPAHH